MNQFLTEDRKEQIKPLEADIHICANQGKLEIKMNGNSTDVLAALCTALLNLKNVGVPADLIKDTVSVALML